MLNLADFVLLVGLAFSNFFNNFNAYFFNFFFFKPRKEVFYYYLLVNFSRLQEFFSILLYTTKLQKAFSSGFLLKVFAIFEKKQRRNVKKHKPILTFFKKFFFKIFFAGVEF